MHLFTVHADDSRLSVFHPEFNEEGVLDWIPVKEVEKLPIWEGDKIFLRLLADDVSFFSLKLEYQGNTLVKHTLYR